MTRIQFNGLLTHRHRNSIAMVMAGWMSLSLVLVFWPCCQTVADELSPVISVEAGDHDHGGIPHGTEGSCQTWLKSTDTALNTSLNLLVSDVELKIGHAVFVASHDFPVVVHSAPDRRLYHASPPASLPLYLRLQHLLI